MYVENAKSKSDVLNNWLVLDIQAVKDSAKEALDLIVLSDRGEEQYWGGNAFLVDFMKHKVIIKSIEDQSVQYEYSKKEIKRELLKWLESL